MKKVVLLAMGAAIIAAACFSAFSSSPSVGHAEFWPGTLADDLGRNVVLSEPQIRIHEVAKAVEEHKLDDLIKQYKKDVASEKDSAVANFALGYAYHVQMAYDPAKPKHMCVKEGMVERPLQEAIRLDPHLEEAYVTLGAYYVEHSPKKAVEFLTRYLEQNPDDAEAMYWIAMAYGISVGAVEGAVLDQAAYAKKYYCYDPDKRISWLRKASQASPGWLLAHRSLLSSYIGRGQTKTESGKWVVAEPWKGLAVEECKTILKLASPTRDSEVIDRVKQRLDDLTKQ